jgi:hypothetical protein
MLNTDMGKCLLIFGLLVMSATPTPKALAQDVVFLKCTYFNGAVARLRLDSDAKKADFLNGGTFTLKVSERFYTLTAQFDFAASGEGIVDLETRINRRSQQLTNAVVGNKRGYFAQYLLSGTCSEDQPWASSRRATGES